MNDSKEENRPKMKPDAKQRNENQVFDYSFGVVTFVKTVFLDGVQNVQIMVESLCPKEINYA